MGEQQLSEAIASYVMLLISSPFTIPVVIPIAPKTVFHFHTTHNILLANPFLNEPSGMPPISYMLDIFAFCTNCQL